MVDLNVEIHIALGFVTFRISYLNTSDKTISGLFILPTNKGSATVLSCDLSFPGKMFSASVIDPSQTTFTENAKLSSVSKDGDTPISTYDPAVFQMPFYDCPPRCEIVVEMKYIQDLSFESSTGLFQLLVPITFPPNSIYQNRRLNDVLRITCLINSGAADYKYSSRSHPLVAQEQIDIKKMVHLFTPPAYPTDFANTDFHISYCVMADEIAGTAIVEPPSLTDPTGAFVLFLRPPDISRASASCIPRNIIFLLDRSGSMSGDPLEQAKSALVSAIGQLHPGDAFAICSFDDSTMWYPSDNLLLPVNTSNVAGALRWVKGLHAGGLTDILSPYQQATKMLSASAGEGRLPFVVLITDGAVNNESEICHYAASNSHFSNAASGTVRSPFSKLHCSCSRCGYDVYACCGCFVSASLSSWAPLILDNINSLTSSMIFTCRHGR